MSGWSFSMTIDTSRLLALSGRLANVGKLLEEVAENTAENVKKNIEQKRIIDTGALRDSIVAEGRGNDESVVRDGVSYGVYNEFGTYKMPARPFFVPAVEKAGELIEQKFTEIFR